MQNSSGRVCYKFVGNIDKALRQISDGGKHLNIQNLKNYLCSKSLNVNLAS